MEEADLDYLPLIRRRSLLLANKPKPPSLIVDDAVSDSPNVPWIPCADGEVGAQLLEQDKHRDFAAPRGAISEVLCSKSEVDSSVDQCLHNEACSGDVEIAAICDSNGTKINTFASPDQVDCNTPRIGVAQLEKMDVGSCSLPINTTLSEASDEVKVAYSDNLSSSSGYGMNGIAGSLVPAVRVKNEISEYSTFDHLDHITLTERQRMLLSRAHSSVKIKDEPLDSTDFPSLGGLVRDDFSLNIIHVKQERRAPNEFSDDEIDNMLLRDRMNLLVSRKDCEVSLPRNYGCSVEVVPSAINCKPISMEPAKPVSISRPRKRKKTATDSVKTALEEDAPGLLQVLIDKGVLVDEIKLYGELESDEALNESSCEDGFSQFEAVISKLFWQRQSFIKLAPIRCTKESRASYCLASLISLVEQAQYLQFRNWPAEWGWCRDLQSFIFVFARHNRIVLERPEYGYATYFFELVDSLPVEWQIKRLVTAMKLTSCNRLSLIENKALMVGDDLSEGEAKVLLEYGWEPNTGLGTMLKYRDRVVHDRKNEGDGSEWRSKIGKMLMDGYNGGTLVLTNIPKKVMECREVQCPEIKLEF